MKLRKVYRSTKDLLKEVREHFPKANVETIEEYTEGIDITFDLVEPDCRVKYSSARDCFEKYGHSFRELKPLKKYIKYTLGKHRRDFVMQTECEKGLEIVTAVKAIKK